jgi:hypothetical protein
MYLIIRADKPVEPRSIGPAMMRTYPNSILKICQSELNALSKIKAGKKIKSKRCASNELHTFIATPSLPRPS